MADTNPQEVLGKIQAMAQGKKIVLHVGCGVLKEEKLHKSFRTPEWFELRCDINPAVKPHIVADMKHLSMLPDGAVDAVWNSHTIEHLYAHEVPVALKEWRRVLKGGGTILMALPNLESVAAHIAHGRLEDTLYTSPAGPITALDVVYGYGRDIASGNTFMAHRTGFTADTLGRKLADAGFTGIKVDAKGFDLWAEARRPVEGETQTPSMHITRDKDPLQVALPPLEQQKHPGALWKNRRPDELDVPPQEVK